MRCVYCDYSDDGVESVYFDSLKIEQVKRDVFYRPTVDKEVCSVCWGQSEDFDILPIEDILVDEEFDDEDDYEIPELVDEE